MEKRFNKHMNYVRPNWRNELSAAAQSATLDLWKEQDGVCYYAYYREDCCVEMQTEYRMVDNGCTVERLNNDIGHVKDNVVLACLYCNHRSHWPNF